MASLTTKVAPEAHSSCIQFRHRLPAAAIRRCKPGSSPVSHLRELSLIPLLLLRLEGGVSTGQRTLWMFTGE
jgi:hypothetical protein